MEKVKWTLDPAHSEIGFKVRHLMITNVSGNFSRFDASVYTTGDDFMSAEIDFWLDVTSINTNNADRDKHLLSPDFFDAEQFKEISFVADSYENVDNDGSYELWGNLTIKGTTKKVKLDVEFGGVVVDPWGNSKAGFTINGKINRKDFGLNWNAVTEAGGVVVSDEIRIACDVQLVKQG
ncbi:MAG: YceI family protein [Chitinophagales bacterium]|nr:YceI family protein [Chitinophagales bacterium]